MSDWPSKKAREVFATLLRKGWRLKRQTGSHRVLQREGFADFVFSFQDGEEIGPRMMRRIASKTGLEPKDF